MQKFMGPDFLLGNETARRLYHGCAQGLPLVDYHCHIPPREIYEDRRFADLGQVWLGGRGPDGSCFGDHYKWRLMRSGGVSEDYVTGEREGLARFQKFAGALELAIGNPMYHWCHMELRSYFGFTGHLTAQNAGEVWALCNRKLQEEGFTVRGIIERSNVAFIGTTDDPADSLEWHQKIAADPAVRFQVCPSFRPDRALGLTKPGFAGYMGVLAASVGKGRLDSFQEVCGALEERLAFFCRLGCRAADHGLDTVPFCPGTPGEVDAAYQKALAGEALTPQEAAKYQTALLLHLGRAYHRRGVVMQLHYSCLRNVNAKMYRRLGPDTGFDMIAQNSCGASIAALLSALDETDECPKTILYSLHPGDFDQISTILGCFQSDEVPGKIQHGAAWWFNDTKDGMRAQLRSLAALGLLSTFVGMLTDSRSFLSYTRHQYFRRILCNLLGQWVEDGEYPCDEGALRRIVEGVCYKNAVRYFGL